MGVYLYLRLSFWRPSGCFLGAWGTILVIMGSRGTPNGHTEGQMSIFIDFRVHFGSLLGPTLGTIGWFSVILDVKVGDSFQIYFLCDPGMEMMPEFRGWMSLNHSKTNGFWRISLLSARQRFGVGEVVFRCHFDTRWWPWDTFSHFSRYWKDIGICIDLVWFPETPGSEESHRS